MKKIHYYSILFTSLLIDRSRVVTVEPCVLPASDVRAEDVRGVLEFSLEAGVLRPLFC